MPNWTRNVIIVKNEEKLEEIIQKHCPINKKSGMPEMDFNTIIQMPKEMNIEYGSKSNDGLSLYLAKINPNIHFYGSKKDKLSQEEYKELSGLLKEHSWITNLKPMDKTRLQSLQKQYKGKLTGVLSLGKKCVQNIKKYKAMNWYEWSVIHWGTKWNAFDTFINGSELSFNTAWDPAIPAMVELSRLHPGLPIAMLFADEQTGANTGYVLMKNGHIDDSGTFKDFSVDAYKLAFRLWGNEDEYHFDKEKNTYVLNVDDLF